MKVYSKMGRIKKKNNVWLHTHTLYCLFNLLLNTHLRGERKAPTHSTVSYAITSWKPGSWFESRLTASHQPLLTCPAPTSPPPTCPALTCPLPTCPVGRRQFTDVMGERLTTGSPDVHATSLHVHSRASGWTVKRKSAHRMGGWVELLAALSVPLRFPFFSLLSNTIFSPVLLPFCGFLPSRWKIPVRKTWVALRSTLKMLPAWTPFNCVLRRIRTKNRHKIHAKLSAGLIPFVCVVICNDTIYRFHKHRDKPMKTRIFGPLLYLYRDGPLVCQNHPPYILTLQPAFIA